MSNNGYIIGYDGEKNNKFVCHME